MKRDIPIPRKLYQEITRVMPIAGSDMVVISGKKVLLLKRNINPLKGYWDIPGGHIRLGETPKQAAIRELDEETGIVISQDYLAGEKVFTYFHPSRQDITITYAVRIEKADIVLNDEHSEYKWFLLNKLPMPISPITVEAINWAFTNEWY